jgi:CRISPR-associated protein Cas2
MARETQFLVISYDVPNDRRRLKLAKLLLDHGAQRVQRSVFEGYFAPRPLARLEAKLQELCVVEEDSIRVYYLCGGCQPRVQYWGQAAPTDEPGLLII